MIVSELLELELFPVADRGIPNKERLPILVKETIDIGQYGVMIGRESNNNAAVPFYDNLYWFGSGILNRGDWLLLYTGGGEIVVTDIPDSKNRIVSIHWGKRVTIFADSNTVPILFRVDAVDIGKIQTNLPQFGAIEKA